MLYNEAILTTQRRMRDSTNQKSTIRHYAFTYKYRKVFFRLPKPVSDYALGEVRDMYLNDCRDRGLRSSTLAYYTGKLANLCAMYGEKIPVSAITPDMLEAFISSGKTPDHNRRISSAFYKFLAEKRIVPPDLFPKVIVPRRRKKHKIPPILTVDETRRLFREIPESFIPAFVLMAFFGVRPQEISNEHGKQVLEVSNVDLVAKTVRIPETIAKMGNFRIISDAPEKSHLCHSEP